MNTSRRVSFLLTLSGCSREKQRRKIEETKIYYLPYAERELILLHEIEAAIDAIETSWNTPKKGGSEHDKRSTKNH